MHRPKGNSPSGINSAFEKVEALVKENRISVAEIAEYAETDYPLFSFVYLSNFSWDKCTDQKLFRDFLLRLKKLSELGWKKIGISDRHSFGSEKIPVSSLNKRARKVLPDFVTDEMKLEVFRASGNNLPFLGLRKGRVFMVFIIEAKFSEVYNHG